MTDGACNIVVCTDAILVFCREQHTACIKHGSETPLSFRHCRPPDRQTECCCSGDICRCFVPAHLSVTPCFLHVVSASHLARVLHLLSAPCQAVVSSPSPCTASSPSCSHPKPAFSSQAESCPSPACPGPASGPTAPRLCSSPNSPSPGSGAFLAIDVLFALGLVAS